MSATSNLLVVHILKTIRIRLISTRYEDVLKTPIWNTRSGRPSFDGVSVDNAVLYCANIDPVLTLWTSIIEIIYLSSVSLISLELRPVLVGGCLSWHYKTKLLPPRQLRSGGGGVVYWPPLCLGGARSGPGDKPFRARGLLLSACPCSLTPCRLLS